MTGEGGREGGRIWSDRASWFGEEEREREGGREGGREG